MSQVILGSEIGNSNRVNLTRDFFGVVENNAATTFGAKLIAGTTLDQGLQFLGATTLRFPGGGNAVDSSWANISGGPSSALYINYITAIKAAIDYCQLRGLSLDLTLNDHIYLTNGALHGAAGADLTAGEKDILKAFLNNVLDYAQLKNVTISTIQIGNEIAGGSTEGGVISDNDAAYGSSQHDIGYGKVVAAMTNVIDYILNNNPSSSRPAIAANVPDWSWTNKDGTTRGAQYMIDRLTQDQQLSKLTSVDLHSALGAGTLELTWNEYFGKAANGELLKDGGLREKLEGQMAPWITSTLTANVSFQVSAWSYSRTDTIGSGLANAGLGVLEMHVFSLLGIEAADCYIGVGSDQSSLVRPNGNITAGGMLFRMMRDSLIGKHAVELVGAPSLAAEESAAFLTRTFVGTNSATVYEISRTAGSLALDLNISAILPLSTEAFLGGVMGTVTVLGVTDPALATSYLGIAQTTAFTLNNAQLTTLGATDIALQAYQIAQVNLQAIGVFGTSASNSLTYTSGADVLHGLGGNDTLTGGAGNSHLAGGIGDDVLYGGAGNDVLYGGSGADTLNGGGGIDTASYLYATAGVTAKLSARTDNTGDATGDMYVALENLIGSNFADILVGDSGTNDIRGGTGSDVISGWGGNDTLVGQSGNDVIYGGAGNDLIYGGGGADKLQGEAGDDAFVFTALAEAGDIINDFGAVAGNNDIFRISASAFGGGLVAGALAAAQFVLRSADNLAQDSNDRFVFNTTNKTLWFDADGNGGGAAILIADLQNTAPNLTVADILLI